MKSALVGPLGYPTEGSEVDLFHLPLRDFVFVIPPLC
jgi:hypothetical protein